MLLVMINRRLLVLSLLTGTVAEYKKISDNYVARPKVYEGECGECQEDAVMKAKVADVAHVKKHGGHPVSEKGIELTNENWAEKLKGYEYAYIKFCKADTGPCVRARRGWTSFQRPFEDTPSDVLAEVHCEGGAGSALCEAMGIKECNFVKGSNYSKIEPQGCFWYPAFFVGDPRKCVENKLPLSDCMAQFWRLNDFEYSKIFQRPYCSVAHLDACTATKREELVKLWKMPMKDLQTLLDSGKKELKKLDDEWKVKVKDLQARYKESKKKGDSEEVQEQLKQEYLSVGKLKDSALVDRKSDLFIDGIEHIIKELKSGKTNPQIKSSEL